MFLIVGGITSTFYLVSYIRTLTDQDLFLGKRVGALLIGSGRFQVYEYSLMYFFENLNWRSIVGNGFMAERAVLSQFNLPWTTDIHNSPLGNLIGLGIIGLIINIIFYMYPIIIYRRCHKEQPALVHIFIISHLVFCVYGLTSTTYLLQPTPQLMLVLITAQVIQIKSNVKL